MEVHNAWYKNRATVFDFFPHLETEAIRERQRRVRQKKAELEAHYRWALEHDPATRALAAQLKARTGSNRDGKR